MSNSYRFTGDLTLTHLAAAVAAERGVSREEAKAFIQSTLDVIGQALADGHRVRLSNFGSWEPGVHVVAAGAMGGRVAEATEVPTVRFHLNGLLREKIRSGEQVDTLKKAPKSY